jgi:ATP-binding cassette subfamily E protein 1
VLKPMNLEPIMDQDVQTLSGGELQRVAICLVLGVPADVLLIDEPSAYLDSEQRIHASKVIKKFVMGSKRTAFVVEHDFVSGQASKGPGPGCGELMNRSWRRTSPIGSLYLTVRRRSSRGRDSELSSGTAEDLPLTPRPEGLLTGMNKFLRSLDITFRRDPTN